MIIFGHQRPLAPKSISSQKNETFLLPTPALSALKSDDFKATHEHADVREALENRAKKMEGVCSTIFTNLYLV